MQLLTTIRTDPSTHDCGPVCVPCERPGCRHCTQIHADGDGECRNPACSGCVQFLLDGDCPACSGSGTEDFHVAFFGLVERRCSSGCVEGKVA